MNFQQTPLVPYQTFKNNQLELWQHVLGFNVQIGEKFCSPFRNDTRPGCTLDIVGEFIRLRDYADPYRNQMNVFQLVQYERNCTLLEALNYLSTKIKLEPTKNERNSIKKYKEQFFIKSYPVTDNLGKIFYTNDHIAFWAKYDIIPQQLLNDYVFPTKAYQAGKSRLTRTVIPKDITFTYYFKNSQHQKIYRPLLNDQNKWLTNCDTQDIWFWKNIDFSKNYLICTKSYKDARILKNLGYNVIALQSESTYLPDSHVKYLEKKFDRIFILFDNDVEGIQYTMEHQRKYNELTSTLKFIPVWYDISLPKDTGDIYANVGKPRIISELKNMI